MDEERSKGNDLEISTRREEGWDVVKVAGEVDLATAPRLREALSGLIGEAGSRVVADLRRVSFIDSSGVETLLEAHKELGRAGGRLAVVCARGGPVAKVLGITGLDKVLSLHGSVEEAIGRTA